MAIPAIPRWALWGVGAAMAASVFAAAIGGAMDRPVVTGTVVAQRDLRFTDLDGGVVGVSDGRTGAPIERLEPGDGNFVRALVRGLANQRKHERNADASTTELAAEPFRLTAWEGGRLTLTDPQTGRAVELQAFGATNEEAFAHLLNLKAPSK